MSARKVVFWVAVVYVARAALNAYAVTSNGAAGAAAASSGVPAPSFFDVFFGYVLKPVSNLEGAP